MVVLPPAISFVFCEKPCTRLVLGERMRSTRLCECTYRALRFSTLSYKDITFATVAPSSCVQILKQEHKVASSNTPKVCDPGTVRLLDDYVMPCKKQTVKPCHILWD